MINKEKSPIMRILPHAVAILIFFLISAVYFSPVWSGKTMTPSDVTQYSGASQELREYYKNEGESSEWTGSMFSGMPAYQIGVHGGSTNFLSLLEIPGTPWRNTVGVMFTTMLMAYILFSCMGCRSSVAAIGAVAYSLSSYNIIILEAGHITKAWTLAYVPLIVAGVLVMFKRKYLLGGLLVSIGLALQLKNNHLQMTYYTGILCTILFIGLAVYFIKEKDIKALLKSSGILLVAVVLAVLCNAGNFYTNLKMADESMRGQSELSTPATTEKQSSGLDKDYVFAWSYGKGETLTLLIPNTYGGASGGRLDTSSPLYKESVSHGMQVEADGVRTYTYWGDQPFTSGPVYFGAVVCFLFVLGMIIIRSKVKWLLFGATIFFIFLAWGKNFETFNDIFFHYFPLYNKFRAVSSALVIPAITMVMVAVWGIQEFFDNLQERKAEYKKALYIAFGITGGLCLFFWIAPGFFFNFVSAGDAQWSSQAPDWYYKALLSSRSGLLSSDAFRSFVFIFLTAGICYIASIMKPNKNSVIFFALGIALLTLIDLWGVDRRYLNKDSFVDQYTQSQTFSQSNADKAILKDKSPSYRVLNLNNPFNESLTSYYHKSIGGYHAAKMKRYQELIEYRLSKEIEKVIDTFGTQNIDSITASFEATPSLNMLNAKYIIFSPEQPPLTNPYALGNAWFVNDYKFVSNADEELASLNGLDPRTTTVIDKRYESNVAGLNIAPDSTASIVLTEYKPNKLTYKSKANSEQLAIFSEIYFPHGWNAYVDGKEAPHFGADWVLRAMKVPAGEHEIIFKFEPKEYWAARMTASISSGVLVILLLGYIISLFVRKKDKKETK